MRREIKGRALGATIQTKKSDESSKTYWTHDNIFISTKKYKKKSEQSPIKLPKTFHAPRDNSLDNRGYMVAFLPFSNDFRIGPSG